MAQTNFGVPFKGPSGIPVFDTFAIPIDLDPTSHRLNYLHTILSRGEITKKIYFAQTNYPIKGD